MFCLTNHSRHLRAYTTDCASGIRQETGFGVIRGRVDVKSTSALLCMLAAVAVSSSDLASAAKPTSCSAVLNLTGRIAYTTGVIHICDIATGVDTNTGVS